MGVVLEINTKEGDNLLTLPIVNMQFKLTKEDVDDIYELTIKKEDIPKIYNNFLNTYEIILDNSIRLKEQKINTLKLDINRDIKRKENIKNIKDTLEEVYNIDNIY